MRMPILLLAALALGAHANPTVSQHGIALTLTSQVEEVYRDAKGELARRLVPPTRIERGQQLVFTIAFHNTAARPADRVVITEPIPSEVAYEPGSAYGPGTTIEFSADGGRSFGHPEALQVRGEDGALRPALPADYTHIRWTLLAALAPKQQGFVQFRAVLE